MSEAITMPNRPPIDWHDYGQGAYNPQWSGYTAAPYITGHPERGWCLYSRDGNGCWNQRTNVEQPPEPGLVPERIDGQWLWVRPCPAPAPPARPRVTCAEALLLLRCGLDAEGTTPEAPAPALPAPRLPEPPWLLAPGLPGDALTWHLTAADGTVLAVIAGPLGDLAATAAVAAAMRALPVVLEALRAVEGHLRAVETQFGGLHDPQERALLDQVCGAQAFARLLPGPTNGGEAPRP